MKEIILSALMLLSCEAIFAEGTDMYLFWMIDTAATYDGTSAVAGLSGYNARVSFDDGATYLALYEDVDATSIGDNTSLSNVRGLDTIAAFSSAEAVGKSFFVELYNEALAGSTTYRSDAVAYGALSSYISSMAGKAQPADTYVFTTFHAIPEPTSGLLLLLGVAGLALKRKRM